MAKTRSAQLLRVAVVTGFMAVLTVGSLVTVIWTVLTTSDNGFDVFGILLLTAAGCLAALFAILSLAAWYVSTGCDPADSHSVGSLAVQFIVWSALSWRGRVILDRLSAASRHLSDVQTHLLFDVLRRNGSTLFGRRHGFDSIRTRADFVAAVPLSSYDNYTEYIDKITTGNKNENGGKGHNGDELPVVAVKGRDGASADSISGNKPITGILTADKVEFLACSAGTSGRNKIIPITRLSKTLAAGVVGPLSFHVADVAISDGGKPCLKRILNLSFKSSVGYLSSSGLPAGPISAYIGRRMPHVVSPPEVYEHVTDEPTALHIHAVFGLAEREVGYVESLFSTLVYSFWKHVELHWPMICDQIEHGRLTWSHETDNRRLSHADGSAVHRNATVLTAIGKRLRPDPERAAELRRIFSMTANFEGVALRVWPGLRAVRMTSTGSFAHYARQLANFHMRGVKQLSLVHAASEGFYGVSLGPAAKTASPASKSDESGATARYSILPMVGFYEFIPVDQLDADQPTTLFADQVSVGESYEMVYTSQTGLYRYRTGDIVKIVDFFNQCPIYEFLYRVGQTLNVYWEKTPESVLYDAVRKAVDNLEGVQLIDYTSTEDIFVPQLAGPEDVSKHYVLFVEVERNGSEFVLNEKGKNMFDEALRETFEMYATFRASGSIGPMRVFQVARGTFSRLKQRATSAASWLTSSAGTCSHPQYKTPRVIRDPAYVELLASSTVGL